MTTNIPEFFYIILIVPLILGLALVGEGINKIVHGKDKGVFLLILGLMFIGVVVIAYLFLSSGI